LAIVAFLGFGEAWDEEVSFRFLAKPGQTHPDSSSKPEKKKRGEWSETKKSR
jgi:hypothetical protein